MTCVGHFVYVSMFSIVSKEGARVSRSFIIEKENLGDFDQRSTWPHLNLYENPNKAIYIHFIHFDHKILQSHKKFDWAIAITFTRRDAFHDVSLLNSVIF